MPRIGSGLREKIEDKNDTISKRVERAGGTRAIEARQEGQTESVVELGQRGNIRETSRSRVSQKPVPETGSLLQRKNKTGTSLSDIKSNGYDKKYQPVPARRIFARAREPTFCAYAWKRVGERDRKRLGQSREATSSQWKPMRAVKSTLFIWTPNEGGNRKCCRACSAERFQGEAAAVKRPSKPVPVPPTGSHFPEKPIARGLSLAADGWQEGSKTHQGTRLR